RLVLRRPAFHAGDFFDAAGVAAPFEFGLEPDLDHAVDQLFAQHVGRQAEHVQIVVPAAHFGRQVIVTRGRADAGKLVGRDAHADARSANQDAAVHRAVADLAADDRGDIRVVDAFVRVRPSVDHFLAQALEQLDQFAFDGIAAMVATDCDTHDEFSAAR